MPLKIKRLKPFAMLMAFGVLTLTDCIIPSASASASSPGDVLKTAATAIEVDQAAHERGKKWEREQQALFDKLRQAGLEYAWYHRQGEKFQRYVDTAEARVAELEKSIVELRRMENELEGELLRVADGLAFEVEHDIPFLMRERQDRLKFIQKTVADYELSLSEKLRRVLEALQAELSYSVGVEWGPGAIRVNDAKQGVVLLRTGRVGYYALALDNSKAWHWTRKQGFMPMDSKGVESLKSAVTMLKTGQFTSLPVLPVLESE